MSKGAANVTTVASSDSSVTLLESNPGRMGFTIENSDANRLHIKFGETASTTDYTVSLVQNEYVGMTQSVYTGRIDGIWATDGSGSAHITEW